MSSWRLTLERAIEQATDPNTASYLQLATFSPECGAQVRSLVFRGFQAATDRLQMVTEHESNKVAELARDPRAQIAWYFQTVREQFRLSGEVICVDHQHSEQVARIAVWHSMSEAARASFFSTAMGALPDNAKALANLVDPPKNFTLLLFEVTMVDHLCLSTRPHTRQRHQRVLGQWQVASISP